MAKQQSNMKKILLCTLTCLIGITACSKWDVDLSKDYQKEKEAKDIAENAAKVLGEIDPNQDWNSIQNGQVTVTADAPLRDIAKVQILTESPFLNPNARVLAEATAQKDQRVTLRYDAPNVYPQLLAACVDSKGHYYIQVFKTGDSQVSFSQGTKRASRRAAANEVPTFTTLKLKGPQWSFNAMRAQKGASCTIGGNTYTEWANSNWNDQMWELADGQTFDGGWQLDTEKNKGHLYRTLDGFEECEKENLASILNSLFYKYANDKYSVNGKKNNARTIRNSNAVTQNDNYLYTDGKTPVTLIPVQAYTDEFKKNNIYYYYFKDSDIPAGMSEVDYIKSLPKFRAIKVERIETTADSKAGTLFRNKEFLLPYYKNAPVAGDNEASAIFPKGYKIGFLNMKHSTGDYNISNTMYGCTYGDGRLNVEVNHIKGHYLTAMDKSIGGSTSEGMQFDDPRIAMLSANGKTYLCFEEGADCNFSDMVIEVGSGIEQVEEVPQVEAEVYTMCFEDRPNQADYDLNDVVLCCQRVNATELQLTLVAAGANDNVYIHGAIGWQYNDREVHDIFHASQPDANGNRFVNTVKGGTQRAVMSQFVTVDEGTTIPEFLKGIYIENKTTGKAIRVAQKGEAPFAIIVPQKFNYPMEKQSITGAYGEFINWARDASQANDWYLLEDADKIFPNLFEKTDY